MLRKIMLGDAEPAFWHGLVYTTVLVGLDMGFNIPMLATNGILIGLLGGFYRGKNLQRLAAYGGSGLVLASLIHWGQPENLWWWRLAIVAICCVVISSLRHAWMIEYLARKRAGEPDVDRSAPTRQAAFDASGDLIDAPTHCIDDHQVETGFWNPDEHDTARSFFDRSPLRSGSQTNRTQLLVRLIDTGVFDRNDCEAIASILYDAPDLEQGLRRCVAYGKLTGFQAECFADNAERRLRVGRYTLLGKLGQGGMGTVYRAFDRTRNEEVALKLFQNLGQHLLFIRREMSIIQELAHPNLVTAYDVGDSDGYHYIAMEILNGQTLQELVSSDEPMSEMKALEATMQIARAMEHMHERGVVHRDIKPSNVMQLACGRYKLMDVGICRPSGELCEFDSFDLGDSQTFGTIGYAAPEQVDRSGRVDFRSDFYSLGSLLFFLLTGKCYLRGRSLRERLHSLLVDRQMRDLHEFGFSEDVVELLTSLLQYDPDKRPQTNAELLKRLVEIQCNVQAAQADCRIAVIVVEDDETDLAVARRILKRSNRSVDLLHSPTFAGVFDVLAEHPPSARRPVVILLDLTLPDSTMDETLSRLSQLKNNRTGIVVVSGDDSPQTRERCLEAGAMDFIPKSELGSHLLERTIFTTASRLLTQSTMGSVEQGQ